MSAIPTTGVGRQLAGEGRSTMPDEEISIDKIIEKLADPATDQQEYLQLLQRYRVIAAMR